MFFEELSIPQEVVGAPRVAGNRELLHTFLLGFIRLSNTWGVAGDAPQALSIRPPLGRP